MNIKIKKRNSKLWNLLKLFFPSVKMDEMWLTFGNTIWTPGTISEDLMCHESVHIYQQKNNFFAIIWWIKYIIDAKFRYSQELPAYRAQYEYIKKHMVKDRNAQARLRCAIATMMSGPHYNNMVSYEVVYKELEK